MGGDARLWRLREDADALWCDGTHAPTPMEGGCCLEGLSEEASYSVAARSGSGMPARVRVLVLVLAAVTAVIAGPVAVPRRVSTMVRKRETHF